MNYRFHRILKKNIYILKLKSHFTFTIILLSHPIENSTNFSLLFSCFHTRDPLVRVIRSNLMHKIIPCYQIGLAYLNRYRRNVIIVDVDNSPINVRVGIRY